MAFIGTPLDTRNTFQSLPYEIILIEITVVNKVILLLTGVRLLDGNQDQFNLNSL